MPLPHPDRQNISLSCAIVTVSDTRTPESDRSGQLIQHRLTEVGHQVVNYVILKDEPQSIIAHLEQLKQENRVQVIILNGGTGIAPRDTTYDALEGLLEKTLPGFGELFRYLSYQEIGSRAMASRAIAGVYGQMLIFSLPGSSNAVKLALDKLILPELNHLTRQIQGKKKG